jgi:hypothetical protein
MWVGATLLSLPLVPLIPEIVDQGAKIFRSYPYSKPAVIYLLVVLSTVLTLWCDAALVIEAFRRKRSLWVSGRLDWVAWISAAVLSEWCVWLSVLDASAYRRLGGLRVDILLSGAAIDAVVLFFDIALVMLAVKTMRDSRPRTL